MNFVPTLNTIHCLCCTEELYAEQVNDHGICGDCSERAEAELEAEAVACFRQQAHDWFSKVLTMTIPQYLDYREALELELAKTGPGLAWTDEDRFYRRHLPGARIEGAE